MAESVLIADIPLGPFEGMPIRVYAGKGKNARLHANDTCSSLRISDVRTFTAPLDAATVRRMCLACARWGRWARPGTALGVFLESLAGTGLVYQLGRYTPGDLAEDLDGRDLAKAAGLLAQGEWPADEDDEDLERAHEEARFLHDSLLLPFWQGAADSLHRAFDVVSRYPWLKAWAQPGIVLKAGYAEQLRCQLAELISPKALLDAAGAFFAAGPELPLSRPEFTVLKDTERVRAVQQAWGRWRETAADSWLRLEEHGYLARTVLEPAFGRKRKGRDEAEAAVRDAYSEWAGKARQIAEEAQEERDKLIVVTIPADDRRTEFTTGDERGFDRLLTRWQLGVIAVHTAAADWQNRMMLLRVPGLIGRRMLNETSELQCAEITDGTATDADPAALLAAWGRDNAPGQDQVLLPGALDDTPIFERRAVSPADVKALDADPQASDQPYLTFSVSDGIEVLQLAVLASRIENGWRGIIIAGAVNLPASLIKPWKASIPREHQRAGAGEPGTCAGTEQPPGSPDFGSHLGMQAGERELLDPRSFPAGDSRRVDRHLRMLAIARVAGDLRFLGSRDTSGPQPVAPAVWYALLAFTQLDLSPFRINEQGSAHPDHRLSLRLPLSVLAPVQLYTTNSNPLFGKGHSPDCRHARNGPMSLDPGYDLLTVADLIRQEDHDWCSRCGGYAVRRFNEAQPGYYRAAHHLLDISRQLDRHASSPGSLGRDCTSISSLLAQVRELSERKPDPKASWYDSDHERWLEASRAVESQAQRIAALTQQPSPSAEGAATVVPLRRDRGERQ